MLNKSAKETESLTIRKTIKRIIQGIIIALPLVFLPLTPEPFEFNKLYILILSVSVLYILWGIEVVMEKKLTIRKTPNLKALGIFLLAVIISTVLSEAKSVSIYGEANRWFPSLISTITLIAFYLVVLTHITEEIDVKATINSFVLGTVIADIIALMSYAGLNPIPGTGRAFNTMGSTLGLGILSVMAIWHLLGITLANNTLKRNTQVKVKLHKAQSNKFTKEQLIHVAITLVPTIYIGLLNIRELWILLILSLALHVLLREKTNKGTLVSVAILSALLLATNIPQVQNLIENNVTLSQTFYKVPESTKLPWGESWNIAISTLRDFPIEGTGPSTFYLNYTRYRSLRMNNTDYWNLRFEKPRNDLFLIISELGLLGIVATGLLMANTFKEVRASILKDNSIQQDLAVSLGLLGIALLNTHVTVTLAVIGIVTLALLETSLSQKELDLKMTAGTEDVEKLLIAVLATPLVALGILGLYITYKVYPAEYYIRKGINLLGTDAEKAYEYQTKALKLNPTRSDYYNVFAKTNIDLAMSIANKESLTDKDKQVIEKLVATALNATKVNSTEIAPLDPVSWEVRSQINMLIKDIAQDAKTWAIKSMQTAIELDPSNPALRMTLGGIYYGFGDYNSAINLFRQAIELKPDYANAYYNFAQTAKQLGDLESARRALTITAKLVENKPQDLELVQKELEELNKQIAGSETEEKPTVEELTTQGDVLNKDETTEQEPLEIENPVEGATIGNSEAE